MLQPMVMDSYHYIYLYQYGCGHIDVVKYLLSCGADINVRDDRRQSPLSVASMCGHCDVVKCLLASDADINLRVEDG
jgi:ankyrin repeat protein